MTHEYWATEYLKKIEIFLFLLSKLYIIDIMAIEYY